MTRAAGCIFDVDESVAFCALFERAPDAMMLVDDDRRYVRVNEAACALFGTTADEILGRTIDEFTPGANLEEAATMWADFRAAGHARGDYPLESRYGPRLVEFSAVADVLPGLHLSIIRDVSDRRATDNDRQLFTDIAGSVQVGLYIWELEDPTDVGSMRLIHANPASVEATGIASNLIVGGMLRDVFPRLVDTEVPAIFADIALGGPRRELGDIVYTDDRISERVFSVRAFPLPNQRVGVAFNDVTRERRAEARALEVVESMSDAFVMVDSDWCITHVNAHTEVLLDRSAETLVGCRIWDEFPHTVDLKFFDEYQRAVRDRVTVEFEEHDAALGIWMSVRAYPVAEGLAIYFQDITERRGLEEQLLQAQKLEAVGQLAGGLAHDFNNLLTVISGYAAFAQAAVDPEDTRVQRALLEITTASTRAALLTSKLLAFSRKQMLDTVAADLSATVSAALDLADPLIGEHITVHRRLGQDVGNVLLDVAHFEQVVLNLAVNARDAMKRGGNLWFETRSVDLLDEEVRDLPAGSYVELTVRDDGEGMDEGTRKQIFNPFYTTKPVGEGSGLGLSMVYGTISQIGGHIGVESTPGNGTTFSIHLPVFAAKAARAHPRAEPPPSLMAGGSERLLVVEDEQVVRNLVVEILESFGYDVLEAETPAVALSICATATFDLMVTDVVMPGCDGSALAREAVVRQPGLRVLYTSGYTPESISHLDLEGSKTAFLAKPFSAADLARSVRRLLDLPASAGVEPLVPV